MKDFYLNYENFLIALAKYLGTEDINAITVVDLREGSIITDLQVAPTSDPGFTEAQKLAHCFAESCKIGQLDSRPTIGRILNCSIRRHYRIHNPKRLWSTS